MKNMNKIPLTESKHKKTEQQEPPNRIETKYWNPKYFRSQYHKTNFNLGR